MVKAMTHYLLELALHPRHQHDARNSHSQQQEAGVNESSHGRIISTWTASTQQTGGAPTKAGDLRKQTRSAEDINK